MRWVTWAIVCVGMGLATTVAIAWALSIRSATPRAAVVTLRNRLTASGEFERQVCVNVISRWGAQEFLVQSVPERLYAFEDSKRTPEEVLTGWRRKVAAPWLAGEVPGPEGVSTRSLHTFGWPWVTMYALELSTASQTWTNVWQLDGVVAGFAKREPLPPGLPIGIAIWPFAGSVLMWGALWMLLICFRPSQVRLRHRRRRGKCLACGYDRRGLGADAPCPECGATP